jgi:hypothetical protein
VVHKRSPPVVPRGATAIAAAVCHRVVHHVYQTAVHDEVEVVAVAHGVDLVS